jgi:hypothetical protein
MKHTRLLILAFVASLAFPGCASYRFGKEWRTWTPPHEVRHFPRKTEPVPNAGSKMDGRWVGHWTSARHKGLISKEPASGKVRCVLTRIDPYRYRAHFEAKWLGFTEYYLVELYGRERRNSFAAKGSYKISPVFGSMNYQGTITPREFSLHYDSHYDSGTMELRKLP